MGWTDERRVRLLKKYWAQGLSASQIASRLGGVTRNAVIGKAHRLGLETHTTTVRKPMARRQAKGAPGKKPGRIVGRMYQDFAMPPAKRDVEPKPEAEPDPAPIEELVIPASQRVTVAILKDHMCRWPVGDPREEDFHFCGAKRKPGLPYCERHARIAYQPLQSRRRDRRAAAE